jgi:two-component system response regulator YesN
MENPETLKPTYHKFSLFDFIAQETVDRFLNMVVEVSGLPVFVEQPMAREDVFASASPEVPGICRLGMADAAHCTGCKKFLATGVHQSVIYGRPYVGRCPLGLSFAFGPLILKRGACTAALVAGFARCDDWKPGETEEFERLTGGLSPEEAEALRAAIPQVAPIKMQAIADFLCTTSHFLMKYSPLQSGNYEDFLNSDMAVARNLIHDYYANQKKQPLIEKAPYDYSNDEFALIQAVALGQRGAAEIQLRDILDKLMVMYGGKPMALKGHIMELAVLISRAPLFHAKYAMGDSFSLNHIPALNPPKSGDSLVLKKWVLNVLHQSIDILERKQDFDVKARIIREAMVYINANLNTALKTEEIAEVVSFSPQHLSRIFKEELGMTLSDYITQVRVEEAKRLLRISDFSVTEISDQLNFYDSTYFAKVFKKETGMTPTEFKRVSSPTVV